MRVLSLGLAMAAILAVGCGDSSGGGTNANGRDTVTGICATMGGKACTGVDTFRKCVTMTCDVQAKAALGDGYASGSFTGVCASYMNCMLACKCDASSATCEQACMTQVMTNAACATPGAALLACTNACAEPVCSSSTSTSTGTGTATGTGSATLTNIPTGTATATLTLAVGTGGCAKAVPCCNTVQGAASGGAVTPAMCTQIAAAGEASCNQFLGPFQQMGLCP